MLHPLPVDRLLRAQDAVWCAAHGGEPHSGELGGQVLVHGREVLAVPAPVRVEVHQQRARFPV